MWLQPVLSVGEAVVIGIRIGGGDAQLLVLMLLCLFMPGIVGVGGPGLRDTLAGDGAALLGSG